MAKQYLQRTQTVDSEILKVITKSKIAHMDILKKNQQEKEAERERKAAIVRQNPNGIESLEIQDEEDNKMASGFVRSDRNVYMRVRDKIDDQI
jgi:hypothetical protein